MKYVDITGLRFGRLTVKRKQEKDSRSAFWLCVCDCGREVVVRGSNLRKGKTKSCGCLHDELSSERITLQNQSHGGSKSRLYGIWSDMKKRCLNQNHWAYSRYGGRGIGFVSEWNDFEVFRDWALTVGYDENLTLDRINNDGWYSPQNCRWVSRKVQGRNKSNNQLYYYKGENLTLSEWSERTGVSYSTLRGRINTHGWSVEKALTTPVRKRGD